MRAVDAYLPWVCGLFLGALEVTGFVYLYGARNIGQHFKLMVRGNAIFYLTMWKFVLLPAFLVSNICGTGQLNDGNFHPTQLYLFIRSSLS